MSTTRLSLLLNHHPQLNTILEERLAEFEAVSKVQGGRLNTVEATATQVSRQPTATPQPK
jgi:hypothetical protein